MTLSRIAIATLIAVTLTACENMQDSPKQTGGTLIGAGLGALIGSQLGGGKGKLAMVAIGALGGAYLGSEVGKSLDRADRMHAERNAQGSLEHNKSGQTSTWSNPDSGHSGTVTPTNVYETASGEDCRQFETTVNIDGQQEKAIGRACRQSDGTWRIVQ
ncbi:MAG: RT0821/Lpp0805 family surface protein [Rhodospirillales bacterium]